MTTMRAKFEKKEDLIYISHLDLMRLLQRAFRRAGIPIKYSEGYNPHPKFSIASALAVYLPSQGEYMDVELENNIDSKDFIEDLNGVLPMGIKILKAGYVEDKSSLMSLIEWASYVIDITFDGNISKNDIESAIENILCKDEIIITKEKKKGKKVTRRDVNIREGIKTLEFFNEHEGSFRLKSILKTGSKGNLKPEAVLDLLQEYIGKKIIEEDTRIRRVELFIEKEGNLATPL